MTNFNIQQIRADFPILNEKIRGKQLVYLDNGASTQKPQAVIDAESYYYSPYANQPPLQEKSKPPHQYPGEIKLIE